MATNSSHLTQSSGSTMFVPGGGGGGSGVLPYIDYTGMCPWEGYGFQAIYSGIGSSNHSKLV